MISRSRGGLTPEERALSLFQPDPALPYRYLETLKSKSLLQPEKRLMLAVLEDAIICFQKHVRCRGMKSRRLFLKAEEWILEEDPRWPFSFQNICEVLELDPDYVRCGLTQWKQKTVAGFSEATQGPLQRAKKTWKKRICAAAYSLCLREHKKRRDQT